MQHDYEERMKCSTDIMKAKEILKKANPNY